MNALVGERQQSVYNGCNLLENKFSLRLEKITEI